MISYPWSACADADDVITPEDVFDIMEEDVQQADLILWVGISFEQSASTAYFRRVSLSVLFTINVLLVALCKVHIVGHS